MNSLLQHSMNEKSHDQSLLLDESHSGERFVTSQPLHSVEDVEAGILVSGKAPTTDTMNNNSQKRSVLVLAALLVVAMGLSSIGLIGASFASEPANTSGNSNVGAQSRKLHGMHEHKEFFFQHKPTARTAPPKTTSSMEELSASDDTDVTITNETTSSTNSSTVTESDTDDASNVSSLLNTTSSSALDDNSTSPSSSSSSLVIVDDEDECNTPASNLDNSVAVSRTSASKPEDSTGATTPETTHTIQPPPFGTTWPELVGMTGTQAKQELENMYGKCMFNIIIHHIHSKTTKDLRFDRIRLFVDDEEIVVRVPTIG